MHTKIRDISEYFSNITIPDSWDSLETFIDWYLNSRMPFMVPWNANVIRTDDATAICIFKKAPYQVELYLIHPNMTIPVHGHPGMEVTTLVMGGGNLGNIGVFGCSESWGYASPKLIDGAVHGGTNTNDKGGYVLLSFEKWPDNTEITSAAIQWKGNTAGSIHDTLLEKYYPQAKITAGYADVTIINKR
jgi:hypothetical protein